MISFQGLELCLYPIVSCSLLLQTGWVKIQAEVHLKNFKQYKQGTYSMMHQKSLLSVRVNLTNFASFPKNDFKIAIKRKKDPDHPSR